MLTCLPGFRSLKVLKKVLTVISIHSLSSIGADNMPGKQKKCEKCGKKMRSDNLKRHLKICKGNSLIIPSQPSNGFGDGLSNFDIIKIVQHLNIPEFRGVYMRDQLPVTPNEKESGIVNLNTSQQAGNHWVGYFKDGAKRLYFDSFGQITPLEIQKYLKTKKEFEEQAPVIARNTDIVQQPNTNICGHLCIYVLDNLNKGKNYSDVIQSLC